MNAIQKRQQGASIIAVIIILAIIGAGVYIALQYIPQYIEAGTVDTILDNIETKHKESPFNSVNAIQQAISRQLNINQMEDLRDNFKVTDNDDTYLVKVGYERELNLIYTRKTILHDKSVTLKK
jgi:Tfp pilus assembly major pilin PilA